MKTILFILILIFTKERQEPFEMNFSKMIKAIDTSYTYLAMGDSYTIGESVLLKENFPNQAVQILRKLGFDFNDPEIIAKTGWTTDELQKTIDQHKFLTSYDFVTLLIGVNNQYRGRKTEDYKSEFESLLKQAIQFAGGKNKHVVVLSIPDWGVTPFAEARLPDGQGRDRKQIANEIDEYNAANKMIAEKYKVNYVDITAGTREAVMDPSLLASDGLHPSGKDYFRWAEKTASFFKQQLK